MQAAAVPPAGTPSAGAPIGGAPMDPSMMGAPAGMPVDPAMAGAAPAGAPMGGAPMDPAMMGGAPMGPGPDPVGAPGMPGMPGASGAWMTDQMFLDFLMQSGFQIDQMGNVIDPNGQPMDPAIMDQLYA